MSTTKQPAFGTAIFAPPPRADLRTKRMEPRFGAAIPQDQWIQRTVTTDPNPRIPFSNGIAGSPGTEPTMTRTERFLCGLVFGFAVGVIFLVP